MRRYQKQKGRQLIIVSGNFCLTLKEEKDEEEEEEDVVAMEEEEEALAMVVQAEAIETVEVVVETEVCSDKLIVVDWNRTHILSLVDKSLAVQNCLEHTCHQVPAQKRHLLKWI